MQKKKFFYNSCKIWYNERKHHMNVLNIAYLLFVHISDRVHRTGIFDAMNSNYLAVYIFKSAFFTI